MPELRHDPATTAIRQALRLRQGGGFSVTCPASRAALDYAEKLADRDAAYRIAATVLALWECRRNIHDAARALDFAVGPDA